MTKNNILIILALLLAFVAFPIFLKKNNECREAGGHYVKTFYWYECIH
jgi:hypothetical protein